MRIFWIIKYLCLVFDCDSPILEALWIAADRLLVEAIRIFPRIKYQLNHWNYHRDTGEDFRFWKAFAVGGYRSLKLELPFTLYLHIQENHATSLHRFDIRASYPANIYYHASPEDEKYYSSRQEWLTALLELFKCEEPIWLFILDFTPREPQQFWQTLRHGKASWVEIQ
jgi:hypothetical protein